MRLLIHPHLMEIGGSQLNAIELAAEAQRAGHDVLTFGPDGPLVDRVRNLGLEYEFAPVEDSWPSWRNADRLTRLVRERRIDLVHGYEWGPALDLAYGPHLRLGVPMVMTVLSMDVPDFLPAHVPLIVGTHELADGARGRWEEVDVMEPPIDTELNRPGDREAARRSFSIGSDECLLAVVCRLTTDLDKARGVLEAIEVVQRLAQHHRVRLLVVGEGPEEATVRRRAAEAGAAVGRPVVEVTGGLLDPRPAYAAADVVLGMGSSALKGMAFGRPLVVQGTAGFWSLLTPENVESFLHCGWFGHGSGDGPALLHDQILPLLQDPSLRRSLGAFGRDLVVSRFSLHAAAVRQEALYRRILAGRRSRRDIARRLVWTSVDVAKFKAVTGSPRLRSWAAARSSQIPVPVTAIR
ncbi:glycosyltransferase family 4 protein [Geodermatophilus nigrescens]